MAGIIDLQPGDWDDQRARDSIKSDDDEVFRAHQRADL